MLVHESLTSLTVRQMPHSFLQFATVGVDILLHSDAKKLEAICAVLLMTFAAVKIIEATVDFGKERLAALVGDCTADTPRRCRKIKLDETETVVLELQETSHDSSRAGTPHWPIIRDFLNDNPRFQSLYDRIFPAISFRGYAVETVLAVLSLSCMASGVGQSFASSGPPRIVAYNMLDVSKGAIRGLNGVLLFGNLYWM
jgi:hypothetical protein